MVGFRDLVPGNFYTISPPPWSSPEQRRLTPGGEQMLVGAMPFRFNGYVINAVGRTEATFTHIQGYPFSSFENPHTYYNPAPTRRSRKSRKSKKNNRKSRKNSRK